MAFINPFLHGLGRVGRSKFGSVDVVKTALGSINGTTAITAHFSVLEEGYASIHSYFELYL